MIPMKMSRKYQQGKFPFLPARFPATPREMTLLDAKSLERKILFKAEKSFFPFVTLMRRYIRAINGTRRKLSELFVAATEIKMSQRCSNLFSLSPKSRCSICLSEAKMQ
jgi:hypothetical protein